MNRQRTSLLLCFLFALGFIQTAHSQGIPSEGKDFYLGFIYPPYNDVVYPQTAGYFRTFAYVSSFQDNVVSVSYFDPITKKEGYPNNYPVKARQTTQIPLDRTQMMMRTGDLPGEFKSCHITAKKPINVQFFSSGANSGGSYLALPVNAWGKEYVVASYKDNGPGNGAMLGGRGPSGLDKAGGVFIVIAAYDGTNVTIIPTARTTGNHYGVNQGQYATGKPQPYTVGLNRGQCWLVKSYSATTDDGEDDISGSIVKSDKPVAVIAGHEDAWIDGSDVAGFSLEARDYMVEQMIPTEYWDNTGHITIPFIDSAPNNGEGIGDLARIFVSDKNVPSIVNAERNGTTFDKHPGTYLWPEDLNYSEFPVHFSADSGKNFMVVQYDIRNHSTQRTTPPFPSPSMMSIVPRAMWRNAYMWYVPSNINERLQAYYVTIIAPKNGVGLYYEPMDTVLIRNWFSDSLRVSVNGSNAFTGVGGLGGQKKKWNTIPGHPDLAAYTYSVSPGTSYYMKAPFPFIVYHFGCRAVDYDGDLGDFDNDDNFFSYALPLGMALSKPVPKRLRITVDTLCSGWRVCVTDSNNPGGIKSVTLLDDPNGEIIIGGRYKWVNAGFTPKDDPLNLKEIVYEPADREICFDVRVENPGQDAYAPLYIVDVNGNGKIVELRYKKASVDFVPVNAVVSALDSNGLYLMPYNSVSKQHEPSYIGEEICREYLFINKVGSPRSFTILKADVDQPSPFRVTNVQPPVGSSVGPGDTVRITACFNGPDTLMYLDSINFETDCFPTRLPLVGHPGTPIIEADDKAFGTILINSKKCSDVEVRNIGNKPFTLDRQWVFENLGNQFQFDTLHNKNILPITLGPGEKHKFWFCYAPTDEGYDSTQMNWHTDIREPYTNQIKPFSVLTGSGIKPGVNWDRPVEPFDVICDDDTIHTVNLINTGTAEAQLTRIWIDGPNANEFEVVETENNTNPPTWGGSVLPVGDTMWVKVKYTPDLSLLPDPYAPRVAFLRTAATLDSSVIPTLNLTAKVRHAVPVLGTNTSTDTLDFGYVQVGLGNEVMRVVQITNTGDAPLIITSYEAPGRPFLKLEPDLLSKLPFVIDTGVTVAWEVWGTMDTYGDTTVPLKFNFATPCVKPVIPQLLFKSRDNKVIVEIPPHPPTYIDCRTSEMPGTISNIGRLVTVNLHKAEIRNGLAPYDDAAQFSFTATGTTTIDLAGKPLASGEVETVPVRYSPSFTGTAGAWLWAEWDSAGTVFQDSTPITAEGVALSNFFSVENTANVGQPYTAVTNDFFVIPVRITQDLTAPKDAQPVGAKGATFTLTWKGDLFDFIRNQMEEMPNLTATIVSGPTRDANGNESVTIHVESQSGDINTAGDLVHLRFQLMISRELLSDFIISDGFFTDASGNPICYILNQHIPAQFVPVDRCGDAVVRGFLNGVKPTTISYLNPNPAVPGADLKLGYRVNVSIAPVTIELYDVLGDKVRTLQANHASAKGDHVATIVTEGLAAGTYTVRLSGADWAETTSFIIEK